MQARPTWLALIVLTAASSAAGRHLQAEPPSQPGPVARLAGRLKPTNWDLPEIAAPGWNLPSIGEVLPGQADREPIIRKKDSLLDEVAETAKEGWWKTKARLRPSRLHPAELFDSQRPAQEDRWAGKADDDPPGFLQSFFGGNQPPDRGVTIDEFMNQPRPRR